jgi:Zn-dependent alcohol dehydrogenase
MKMKAAILVEQKKPLVIDEVEIPELRFGQVLVRITCSGICGSQLGEINGVKGPDRFLPHLLGHEGTAVVEQIGEGVTTVKLGDTVALHWRPGSGIQGPPPKYKGLGGVVNAGWIATFNEYAVISENRMTVIPPETNPEEAALLGCAVTTGFGVINNNAQVKIGESVLVYGAGGIGLNIIQAAKMVSAWPIIAVDLYDNRLKLAKTMGATHTINSRTESVDERIAEIIEGGLLDVAVDNTGNPQVIQSVYNMTKPTGTTVLVGVPAKGNETQIYTLPLHFEKKLTGSHGGEADPARDIPRYIKLMQQGLLDLKPLIAKRYPLDEINQAIDDMRSGAVAGRCIITMGDEQ